ncbi:hypothetical protein ZIOFF_052066 [Zingiber officinale]|uniref:Protein kinase domain-containing protein n=1 Tax=Zingiber officinale TaxID=94328 RepID=A0A8J5KNA0_ZINOF|nr:hypothetical protein ZIOFF_052066 [Zingiber officinale]
MVIHRDTKASNVLLDSEMNQRLEFTTTATIHRPLTLSEPLDKSRRRRLVDWAADINQLELLQWVLESCRKGSILETRGVRFAEEFVAEEVELVLKLGLLCTHLLPAARPNMHQVVEYLEGSSPLPELAATYLSFETIALQHRKSFEDYMTSYPSSSSVATATSIAGAW